MQLQYLVGWEKLFTMPDIFNDTLGVLDHSEETGWEDFKVASGADSTGTELEGLSSQ